MSWCIDCEKKEKGDGKCKNIFEFMNKLLISEWNSKNYWIFSDDSVCGWSELDEGKLNATFCYYYWLMYFMKHE